MGPIRRFLRLPIAEKTLLGEATALLLVSRIGLRMLPFATLRRFLSLFARIPMWPARRSPPEDRIQRIVWAVEAAGRRFPALGTCLTQALTAHVLLARTGCASNLRIGVTREPSGRFLAHAWLENDGVILIGGEPGDGFTPMPLLNGLHL